MPGGKSVDQLYKDMGAAVGYDHSDILWAVANCPNHGVGTGDKEGCVNPAWGPDDVSIAQDYQRLAQSYK